MIYQLNSGMGLGKVDGSSHSSVGPNESDAQGMEVPILHLL